MKIISNNHFINMVNEKSVLMKSGKLPDFVNKPVKGYDFNQGINYDAILQSYNTMGIQATNLGTAINIINEMIQSKQIPLSEEEILANPNPIRRKLTNCTIFLGYTANLVSCGARELIRYLAEHDLIDVIVSSAGGIEEDFIKCLQPSYIADFQSFNDNVLRASGINRIGNMIVPNNNYVEFAEWLSPLIGQMHREQETERFNWTPSKFINRLGKEINHPDSIYYWCYKNNIPVFCPGLTDGSIGDLLHFYLMSKPGFRIDVAEDVHLMNTQAVCAKHSGMIILGGGTIKHHIANANLMRDGCDFSVYINTGNEFDASDSGASPEEAVSWGKIKSGAKRVKVHSEASLVFPLIVAQTFAKFIEANKMPHEGASTSTSRM